MANKTKAELEAENEALKARLEQLEKPELVTKSIRIRVDQAESLEVAGITVAGQPRAGYLSDFMRDLLDLPATKKFMTSYVKDQAGSRPYVGQFGKYNKKSDEVTSKKTVTKKSVTRQKKAAVVKPVVVNDSLKEPNQENSENKK